MKVRVYRNLHRDCFSIQDAKTKRVIGHASSLYLTNVTFKVYESGRQRVLREKKKNVHAYVIGEMNVLIEAGNKRLVREIHYSPYECDSFVNKLTGERIDTADKVMLIGGRVYEV